MQRENNSRDIVGFLRDDFDRIVAVTDEPLSAVMGGDAGDDFQPLMIGLLRKAGSGRTSRPPWRTVRGTMKVRVERPLTEGRPCRRSWI